jgi:hypothetical protein
VYGNQADDCRSRRCSLHHRRRVLTEASCAFTASLARLQIPRKGVDEPLDTDEAMHIMSQRTVNLAAVLAGFAAYLAMFVGHFYASVVTQNVSPAAVPWFNAADAAVDALQGVLPAFIAGWVSCRSGGIAGLAVGVLGGLALPFVNALLAGDGSAIQPDLAADLASLLSCGALTGTIAGTAAGLVRSECDLPPVSMEPPEFGAFVFAVLCGLLTYVGLFLINFYASKATLNPSPQWDAWCTALLNFLATLAEVMPAFVAGWLARRRGFALGVVLGVLGGFAAPEAIAVLVGHPVRFAQGLFPLVASLASSGAINGAVAGMAGHLLRGNARSYATAPHHRDKYEIR